MAVHPSLTTGGVPMPVVTVGEVEKGRAMAVTTDSTWRWAFADVGQGGTGRPYHAFWNSAIRWLIKDPELKLLRVQVDDSVVTPGTSAQIAVRLVGPDYSPAVGAKGELQIYRRSLDDLLDVGAEPSLVSRREFTTDARGHFEAKLPVDETGAYTVRAVAETKAGKLTDEDVFLVTLDSQELRSIQPREHLLEMLASTTNGGFELLPDLDVGDFHFKEPRVVQVNRRHVIEMWDSLLVLLVICGLLGAEWWLRRRWGRL